MDDNTREPLGKGKSMDRPGRWQWVFFVLNSSVWRNSFEIDDADCDLEKAWPDSHLVSSVCRVHNIRSV